MIFSLLFLSCNKTEKEEIESQNITVGIESEKPENDYTSTSNIPRESQILTPQIPIDRDYSIIQIVNKDIDLDEPDEQIILAGPANDNTKKVKLYIADYDISLKKNIEIFSAEISNLILKSASIEFEDITGDHNSEIIIHGIDSKGIQFFEIYRLIASKNANHNLTIDKIFSKQADGFFEIKRFSRSSEYTNNRNNNESYNIEVQKKNPEDDKSIIKEIYKWNSSSSLFVLNNAEKIKITAVSDEKLQKLYGGSVSDSLQFLNGSWYKINNPDGKPTHNMDEIIIINILDNSIMFYSNAIIESYTWKYPPIKYNGYRLYFNRIKNDLIQTIFYPLVVNINSMESIKVEIKGNDRWGGTYTQLTSTLQHVLTDKSKENILESEIKIKGLYKSNLDSEITFDYPKYTLKKDNKETMGIYTIFNLYGEQILEMKEIQSNGIIKDKKSYKLSYNETSDDMRIIRTITLNKGSIQSKGILLSNEPEFNYEQIEKKIEEVIDN